MLAAQQQRKYEINCWQIFALRTVIESYGSNKILRHTNVLSLVYILIARCIILLFCSSISIQSSGYLFLKISQLYRLICKIYNIHGTTSQESLNFLWIERRLQRAHPAGCLRHADGWGAQDPREIITWTHVLLVLYQGRTGEVLSIKERWNHWKQGVRNSAFVLFLHSGCWHQAETVRCSFSLS